MILHKFVFGPIQTNTLLFACPTTKKAAVIDPSQGSTPAVLKKAAELGLLIEKILLTHSHWDHIADLHELLTKVKATVYVHPLDAANVERPGSDGLPLFFPIYGVKPDHLIQEGEQIAVGDLLCEVIHSPGHSPGGVCYYLRKQKLLFSGDTLFEGSIGNIRLPTGQPERMWDSLAKLDQLPKDTHVVPGHGADTILSQEHWLGRARELFS